MSRAGGLLLLFTFTGGAALGACALVAGIEDINVVSDGGADGVTGESGPTGDGSTPPPPPGTDGSVTDTGPDAPPFDAGDPCPATETFSTPIELTALDTTSDDWSARLTQDESTVVFASSRPGHIGGASIYTSTRAGGVFGIPSLLPGVNSATATQVHPSMTQDHFTIVMQVTTTSTANIAISTRGSTATPFPATTTIPSINVNDNLNPFISADGTDLWFASNRTGTFRIYESKLVGLAFGPPQLVDLGATTGDQTPVLDANGLTLYFSSSRIDSTYDVYRSQRMTLASPWTPPVAITELNIAGKYDAPTWISPDGCRLYFMTNRPSATGTAAIDVWQATRFPP